MKQDLTPRQSTHIFISYAHEDTSFIQVLVHGLTQNNIDVWVDWEGIAPTSKWWDEILKAIEGSSAFVFVASRHSLESEVCRREIEHATLVGKRIIPFMKEEVKPSTIPEAISSIQWIPINDQDNHTTIITKLIEAVNLDLEWNEKQAMLLLRIREWEESKKNASFLLRGRELEDAEVWLDEGDCLNERNVPHWQIEYIRTSRKGAADRLKRIFVPGLLLMFLVYFALQWTNDTLAVYVPGGILALEFAGSFNDVQAILNSWSDFEIGLFASLHLGLDFLNIFLYTGTMFTACFYYIIALKRRSVVIWRIGRIAIVLVVLAGLMDVIENIALISLLFRSQYMVLPKVAYWCALSKLSSLVLAVIYLFMAFLRSFWLNRKSVKHKIRGDDSI